MELKRSMPSACSSTALKETKAQERNLGEKEGGGEEAGKVVLCWLHSNAQRVEQDGIDGGKGSCAISPPPCIPHSPPAPLPLLTIQRQWRTPRCSAIARCRGPAPTARSTAAPSDNGKEGEGQGFRGTKRQGGHEHATQQHHLTEQGLRVVGGQGRKQRRGVYTASAAQHRRSAGRKACIRRPTSTHEFVPVKH